MRYPSIETDVTLAPGSYLTVTFDLARAAVAHTMGGPVTPGPLQADWEHLDLSVVLLSASIAFEDEGRGSVTIRRNAESLPARIRGRVDAAAQVGDIATVSAIVFHDTRYCGAALRMFKVTEAPEAVSPTSAGSRRRTRAA